MTPKEKQNQKQQLTLEAYRLAEQNLMSETSLAIAADQRAITFCGILIATIAIASQGFQQQIIPLSFDMAILLFVISALLAAFSARSVPIFSNGLSSDSFIDDITNERSYYEIIVELSSHYDQCSAHNRKIIKYNSKIFNTSLFLSSVGFICLSLPSVFSLIEKICGYLK